MYSAGQPWIKKTSDNHFDVTMGSYDGAETCELVGAYLLHQITTRYGTTFGLYRDDGLGISKDSPRKVELIKKDLCTIFKDHGLKITIEANKTIVNFLDVTLNQANGSYMPYIKTNNVPHYVHSKSNHPPTILKNIPESINRRLSEISSDEESFKKAAAQYQHRINDSGYDYELKFKPPLNTHPAKLRRSCARNIIWYNPPYSRNVSTNIGREFFKILDEEFPNDHPLHKIFNRNTVKMSYGCMTNIKQIIDGQNKGILAKQNVSNTPDAKSCNCRKPYDCPVAEKCLKESVIYQATVTNSENNHIQTYIGLTANTFKTRFNNHKCSFKNKSKKSSTELSKHIWELNDSKTKYSTTWKILKNAKSYDPATSRCNLCICEKYFIICKPQMSTLNRRNELVSACRHASNFILRNFIT